MTRLQNAHDRLQERVVALELRGQKADAGSDAAEVSAPASTDDHPPLRVVKLGPTKSAQPADDGSSTEHSTNPPPDDSDAPRPVIRAEGERYHEGFERPSSSRTGSRARVEYRAALELMRGKQYEVALQSFRRFLRRHPENALAADALFWAAECEYRKGQYADAEHAFKRLVQRYPHGRRTPDALLRVGLSEAQLGRDQDARASFALLSQNYPGAAATRRIPKRY